MATTGGSTTASYVTKITSNISKQITVTFKSESDNYKHNITCQVLDVNSDATKLYNKTQSSIKTSNKSISVIFSFDDSSQGNVYTQKFLDSLATKDCSNILPIYVTLTTYDSKGNKIGTDTANGELKLTTALGKSTITSAYFYFKDFWLQDTTLSNVQELINNMNSLHGTSWSNDSYLKYSNIYLSNYQGDKCYYTFLKLGEYTNALDNATILSYSTVSSDNKILATNTNDREITYQQELNTIKWVQDEEQTLRYINIESPSLTFTAERKNKVEETVTIKVSGSVTNVDVPLDVGEEEKQTINLNCMLTCNLYCYDEEQKEYVLIDSKYSSISSTQEIDTRTSNYISDYELGQLSLATNETLKLMLVATDTLNKETTLYTTVQKCKFTLFVGDEIVKVREKLTIGQELDEESNFSLGVYGNAYFENRIYFPNNIPIDWKTYNGTDLRMLRLNTSNEFDISQANYPINLNAKTTINGVLTTSSSITSGGAIKIPNGSTFRGTLKNGTDDIRLIGINDSNNVNVGNSDYVLNLYASTLNINGKELAETTDSTLRIGNSSNQTNIRASQLYYNGSNLKTFIVIGDEQSKSVTVSASSYNSVTFTLSRSNCYPLSLWNVRTSSSNAVIYSYQLSTSGDEATVTVRLKNLSSSSISPTVYVKMCWFNYA